ncbi:ATP-binding protein [Pseudonocardia adelaidensis]|uniref:AAA ATPase-like protein n=1 Tax=Pseudonocardia adelaidensis TaxID=648754 RepID=A0ABP9NUG9_9PSEU
MTAAMKGFRCWTAGSVRQTVYTDIGALPSDADSVFLAAHTPMALSHPTGKELPDAGSGERQVLDAVLHGVGDTDRNTLIAVTGASGAGKSHVVRWVHANLDPADERYHILYVPRAVQTIRELLRRIVVALPGEGGQKILDRIDRAVGSSSPAEVADRLLEEVRHALTWTIDQRLPVDGESADEREAREVRNTLLGEEDEQGKRRDGLADLIAIPQINKALLRPDGCIDGIVQSFYEATSRRDSQLDGFRPEHLPLRETGIRRAIPRASELSELWSIIVADPAPAVELLNEALRHAVPKTLGLRTQDRESLDLLFRSARENLREDGKELVLLFEDLAQFGLVDGELYDQFTIQPGDTMAPLRVVFAVTDGPFNKLPKTVQTRITHRFQVGESALADRDAFVGRYLNLVRIGREDVESAWERAKKDGTRHWVRNACDTREDGQPCRVRDECHAGFGFVEVDGLGDVGLYPYNATALRRALKKQATPRKVLEVCVSDALMEADGHIERGTYPHERTFEQFDNDVHQAKHVLLSGASGKEADRLYRALVLWGDESPLTPAVLDAFALSDITARAPDAPDTLAPPDPTPPVTTGEKQESPLPRLFQWFNGTAKLPDDHATFYRNTLHHLVRSRLDLDQDLFHLSGYGHEILSGLFNVMSIDFGDGAYGRRIGTGGVRIPLQRTEEDVDVMVAARWFSEHGHWLPERGLWEWPSGYTPAELMLKLETWLDKRADEVRRAFLDRVRGRGVARAAVGIRAIALLATGASPAQVGTLDGVLSGVPAPAASTISGWGTALTAARNVLHNVKTAELIGQFAAVRQGDAVQPQLVDLAGLATVLDEATQSPTAFLQKVTDDLHDVVPVVEVAARDLRKAIEDAAPQCLGAVEEALENLRTGLEGRSPVDVAQTAREVGKRALENGLLRPPRWDPFTVILDVLTNLPPDLPYDWKRPAGSSDRPLADEALAMQHWAGHAADGGRALAALQQTMKATAAECLRRSGGVGDVEQLQREVREKLDRVEAHLEALSVTEASRA